MFSRILIKLIDEAIFPALAIFVARLGSSIFLAQYYGVEYSLGVSGFVYNNQADFIFVNSYSTLVVIAVVGVGLLYNLTKSHLFHETHVDPSLAARLHSFRVSRFIQTSFDLYSQGVVWLSYSFLVLFASIAMTYFDLLHTWVLWVSVAATFIGTYLFIIDVERELLVGNTASEITEEVVLKIDDGGLVE